MNAEISGKTLNGVRKIPRRALLEGNRAIVIVGGNKIAFRVLTIPRLTRDTALVSSGLEAGDRVVLTRLSAPIAGMEIEIDLDVVEEENETFRKLPDSV